MSRSRNKSDDEDESEEEEEEEDDRSKSRKGKSEEHKDSDAENRAKPVHLKRAESATHAPEYHSTPTKSASSKGSLADDFDYGDGSLEDMQRLMKLYQKDPTNPSSSSSKGRVAQSVLSSTAGDFDDDSPPKVYTAPKRGRRPAAAVAPDSPSSPHSGEADDVPDPAAEWLKSFRLGCKECDVDEFSSDNLFVQHHLEMHKDDRPYKCQNLEKDHVTPKANPDCTSSFRQRHHYKEHIRGEGVSRSGQSKHWEIWSCQDSAR